MVRSFPSGVEQLGIEATVGESAAYDGGPGTTAKARAFAVDFLTRAQAVEGVPVTARAVEVVRLVVSELIGNVARHAPGPCLLALEIVGDDIRVTVWDTAPTVPVPRTGDVDRIGQHGLEIVLALCPGFEIERQAAGKRVRVRIPLD